MTVFKNLLTPVFLLYLTAFGLSSSSVHAQNKAVAANDTTLQMHADTLKKDSLHAGISNEIKSKVHYTADDTIEFDISNEKVYLYKKAQVNYENIELKAAFISVDWNSKNVFSSGLRDSSGKIYDKPVFKDGDDEFKADTMRYNFDTKKGKVYNVTTSRAKDSSMVKL